MMNARRIIPAFILAVLVFSSCSLLQRATSSPQEQAVSRRSEALPKLENKVLGSEQASVQNKTGLEKPENNPMIDELLAYAKSKLGCRYRAAGVGPDSFDCSGFTRFVFAHFKVTLPHSSSSQFNEGVEVKEGEPLKPGDLAFWAGRSGSSVIGHVGIVVEAKTDGTFTFIHAASDGIRIDRSTAPYYASRYRGARRIIL